MSRCIMVLSALRSGSSCTAGALHRLGVDMGTGHLQPADKNNLKGYYEDLRWQKLNKQITGFRYYSDAQEPKSITPEIAGKYGYLAHLRESRYEIWGLKGPRACFTAHWIWPYMEDCRLVIVHRPLEQVIASTKRHSERSYAGKQILTKKQTGIIIVRHVKALKKRQREFKGPVLKVEYLELLAHPKKQLERLEDFCFEGLDHLRPDYGTFQGAVNWIDPRLNHHG